MALPNLVQIKQALDKMMPELSPVPIGSIAYSHEVPTGWLECNGAAISRTKYARLFKKIGTKYGAGDGSTTFNLPNLHHRVLEATTTISEVAKTVEAGLPDIIGRVNAAGASAWQEPNGCFYFPDPERTAYMAEYSATKQSPTGLGFKASNENAIYRGTTLQNNALRLLAIVKY